MALDRPILEELPEAYLLSQDVPSTAVKVRRAGAVRTRALISFTAVLVVGLAIANLALQAEFVRLSYELTAASERFQEKLAENERFEYRISQLKSLDRIEVVARQSLGMGAARNTMFVMLPADNETIVRDGSSVLATAPKEFRGLFRGIARTLAGLIGSSETAEAGVLEGYRD